MTTTFEKCVCGTLIIVDRNSMQHVWLHRRMMPKALGACSENFVAYLASSEDLQHFSIEFYLGKKSKQEITTKDVFGNEVKVGDTIIYSSSRKGGIGAVVVARVEKIKKAIRAKVMKSSSTYKTVGDTITIVSNFVKVNGVTW
jgi:hypothetical protein